LRSLRCRQRSKDVARCLALSVVQLDRLGEGPGAPVVQQTRAAREMAAPERGGAHFVRSRVAIGADLVGEVFRRQPGLPVVLATGYDGQSLTAAEKLGVPLLRKPYRLKDLAGALAMALRTSSGNRLTDHYTRRRD